MLRSAWRRAVAHRGLLALVALLVAAIAATSGATAGAVTATTTDAARTALDAGSTASLQVTTRVAEDPAAQDARVRSTVADLFGDAPLRVDRTERPDGDDTPFVEWTLTPVVTEVLPADLAGFAAGGDALHGVLRADDAVAVRGLTVEGDLAQRAVAEQQAQAAARAVLTVPVALLVLVALVALVQVARLVAQARERETEILVARGADPGRLTAAALGEAATVCLLAAAAGSAAAAGALSVAGTPSPAPTVLVAGGLATAVAGTTVLTVVAGSRARAVARRRLADRSGRLQRAAAAGTVAGVGLLAVAGMWRLRSLGSPLVAADGATTWDPLAAAGPALALAALGLLALALLGPLARAGARLAARGRGATAVLAARQVSRGLRVAVVPVVLLVLAGGSSVLAATYAGTAPQARADLATQQLGTDVRAVDGAGARLAPERLPIRTARLADLDGASGAVPVLAQDATVQGDPLGLVAMPADAAPDAVRPVGAAAAVAPLRGTDPFAAAPVLPSGTTGLTIDLTGTAVADPAALPLGARDRSEQALDVAVTVWLVDAHGALAVLDAGALTLTDDPADTELAATVPATLADASELRVAALEWDLPGVLVPTEVSVAVSGLDADVEGAQVPVDVAGTRWAAAGTAPTASDDGALGADLTLGSRDGTWLRLLAADGPGAPQRPVVPAVVTEAAAQRWDAAVGDELEATVAGAEVVLRVAATTDTVPGESTAEAAWVDLGTLEAALLATTGQLPRPAEAWVAADEPGDAAAVDRVADDVAQRLGPTDAGDGTAGVVVRTVADVTASDAGAPVRLAMVLAAAGATVLAVLGLAVVAVTTLGARRGEVVVLRALGVGPRQQGRGRAGELVVLGGVGLGAGVLAGAALAAATVPGLAHAVVRGGTTPGLVVDATVLVPLLLAAVVGVLLVGAVVASRVAAQARDTTYRAEVR
ncbi:FtsX-like permease family protein [Isoptericola haloaureus]|uniref:FtsX-like permease family protein n=1 Tax=Isoptericola haloaureus TaxID=1542902 RepID=A0ABU7Z822_9MICO